MGGTGKSTIASYLYQKTNFAAKFWADVSLNPDFTIFAEKVITAFGGKISQPIEVTQLINNLLDLLSQRRCLLIIDNLETLIDESRNWQNDHYQQFFSRWLRQGTTSIILITTRDKPQLFQGLSHWYSLRGMKIAEGISLLTKLGIEGTERELEEFVQYVDGHPLTIDLVAGYLREYCESQLSQVAALGLDQFELAYEEASGAHRNKQDVRLSWIIQQHLQRLTSEQKNFLVDLSVYRLPFDREAASYIRAGNSQKTNFWHKLLFFRQWFQAPKQDPKIDIVKVLQELCNRSLLIKTQDNKYIFQALVKEYIYQQEKRDSTTSHQKAIQYYGLYLKEKESWQVLEDISEYLEIIYHLCEFKEYPLAKKVINICYDFLSLRGYHSILLEIHENLIPKWQRNLQHKDRSKFANSLVNLANAYYFLGDYTQAIHSCQQSLKVQQKIRDRYGIAESLMVLGNAYNLLGEYQKAIKFHQQSLEIKQQIGDSHGEAASLGNLGNTYNLLGEYQRAIELYQQSLEIAQHIDDSHGEAASLGNLGSIYNSLGEYQKAINFHQQSLKIQQQICDRNGEATSLDNLGSIYNSLGEYQKAINFHQQSLKIQRQIDDRNGEAASLNNLGNAYGSLGEYHKAIDFHKRSLEIAQHICDRNGKAASLNNLGVAYNSLGEYQQAIDFYQHSLDIHQQIGDRNGKAASLNNLGSAYKSLGEYHKAIDFHKRSLEIAQQICDRNGEANSLNNLGNAYGSLGEYHKAIDFHKRSLEIAQHIFDRNGEARSLGNLGNVYNSLGEYHKAIKFYQQSLEIKQQIGDRHGEAYSWFNLGNTKKKLQKKTEAKIAYKNARKLYQAIGLDKKIVNCDEAIKNLEEE